MRHIPVILLLAQSAWCLGQNQPPAITITGTSFDPETSSITVEYDLADAEGDPSTVWLRASSNGGSHYDLAVVDVVGDAGPGITPGTGRTIVWHFTEPIDLESTVIMVVADDGHIPHIQDMVDQVTEESVAGLLNAVAIPRHHTNHPAGLASVRDTMAHAFQTAGLELILHDAVHAGVTVPNVIGRHPGLLNDGQCSIVDGHYDAVTNTPGADDNATGVVGTLEAARILAQYTFRNSLRFVGFAFEEQGLIGSGQYVQSAIPSWETITGVLNLEMVGFYSEEPGSQNVPAGFELLFPDAVADIAADDYRGNFLTVVGNTASQPLIDTYLDACDQYVPELRRIPLTVPGTGLIAPDLRRSDHSRFWDAGLPALMLTDGSEFRNPNYHQPADAPATVHIGFLTNCVKATVAAAAMLAEPIHAGWDVRPLTVVGLGEHHHAFPCTATATPQPVQGVLQLELGDCAPTRITARLFDANGRLFATRHIIHGGGPQRHTIPIEEMASGSYLLVLESVGASETLPLMIQR